MGRDRPAQDLGSGSYEIVGACLAVRRLKRNPYLAGYTAPNLNLIDCPGLRLVEDFQRCATCIKEHSMAAIVFPGGHLLQTERVSEERCRAVKVVHRQYESQFVDWHGLFSHFMPSV